MLTLIIWILFVKQLRIFFINECLLLLLLGGLYNIIISNNDLLILGFLTSSINFIFLFFGQRVAKDYDGAAVIVNYFILNMIGLLSISLSIV